MTIAHHRVLEMLRQRLHSHTGWMLVFLFFVLLFFSYKSWVMLALPFCLLALAWCIQDFRRIYFVMWATIPFAIEVDLPGGLATDFPAEPLMWFCCLMLIPYLFLYYRRIDFRFVYHPVFVILAIHFFWIVFTSVISTQMLLSAKYTLAKTWYLVCFVFIPLVLFRELRDFRHWLIWFLIPLSVTIIIILIRHSRTDFTFSTINSAVIPIYRNHVDYACVMGIVLPFMWIVRKWFIAHWGKVLLGVSVILMLTGIYFSYTRAAWLCIPVAFIAYYLIRWRMMRAVIPFAVGTGFLIIAWLSYQNQYLEYAPDYEKAITHERFDDLVSATYRMEDISTVERFYRWVAGIYMIGERPITGFGPSSFYSTYHSYADRHFTTYVSDNPEQSGMHNYYLMVAVEQGLPGLVIFLTLLWIVITYGESLYHRMTDGTKKQLLIAALVSFICNLFILTLNDMVETDKLGSFFFICIAIVILLGHDHQKREADKIGQGDQVS